MINTSPSAYFVSKTIFGVLIITLSFSSCKKESDLPANLPEVPEDTTNQSYYGTPFDSIPDNEDIVMYEVNLRAFSNSGDIRGVIGRLDEIKSLGVNVIWLMPIHPVGEVNSVNSPYSVKDYKAIGPEYGTLSDLRALTDQAHSRNMAVILDWVANHTAWDNEWINNKSWYSQDGSGNIIHPPGTNWLDVADLNFSNDEMRLAMIDAMKYWVLEANIDGFRCDYADGVPPDFWKQAIDTLEAIPGREYVLLAEGNRSNHYSVGFDLTYSWDFYNALKSVFNGQSATTLHQTHQDDYNGIPEGKHKLRFTTNHDESAWDETPVVLFNGADGALAASVVNVFMGGAPLFYTGQEVGTVENVPFFSNAPIDWDNNPEMHQEYKDMMAFYASSTVVKNGYITNYPNSDIVCFVKESGEDKVLVIVNIRNGERNLVLPAELRNTSWKDAITGDDVSLEVVLPLDAYQYYILQ